MIYSCFLGCLNRLSTCIIADYLVSGHQCDNSNEEEIFTAWYRRPRPRTTWGKAKSKHAATNALLNDFICGSFPYHYSTIFSLQNHLSTPGSQQSTKHRFWINLQTWCNFPLLSEFQLFSKFSPSFYNLHYDDYQINFYVHTLSSKLFRAQFIQMITRNRYGQNRVGQSIGTHITVQSRPRN